MPLQQYNDIQMPEWLQGASWEVRLDVTDGSGEFGLRENGAKSGHRRVLADFTVKCLGQQLMALESFLVSDINNCSDKFLANYLEGSGIKNGVVKMVGGYDVRTDGRTHTVTFTLELPSRPERAQPEITCTSTNLNNSDWSSSDFQFFSSPNRWASDSTAATKTLSALAPIQSGTFHPCKAALTIANYNSSTFSMDVYFRASSATLSETIIIGGGSLSFSFAFESKAIVMPLDWPTGNFADTFVIEDIFLDISASLDDIDILCIELTE
jgi:hypothetical protein